MEIYKLDIDTAKPTNQVLAMQQNSAGMLSVNVTNDGKYIRNLSVDVYDGDTEIEKSKYGYKVNIGTEPKHVKVVAKSTPEMSERQYILSAPAGTRVTSKYLIQLVLKSGVYNQDEFMPLLDGMPTNIGIAIIWATDAASLSNTMFDRI